MTESTAPPSQTPLTPAALTDALATRPCVEHPALPGRSNHLRCGVLVPIRWQPDPVVLMTRRPPTLKHGGEWCYPGGRPEAVDGGDLYATASREGREELGLTDLVRLGRLASMPIYTSDFRLEPFVVEVRDAELRPCPEEVEAVHAFSITEAVRAETVQGIPFLWEGEQHYSPIYPIGDSYLFGATAHTFTELIALCAPLMGYDAPKLVETTVTWEEVLAAKRRR